MLTGEHPEVNPEVRARLAEYGHEDFTAYVVWTCERALERGLLPHTNLGVLTREDLARLREVTASQGLMLESVSERLMQTVHAGSPDEAPETAPGDDRGGRRAEDSVHERDPRGDRRDRAGADRIARGARRCARAARPHPGGDPAELRSPPELLRAKSRPRSPTRRRASTGARASPTRTRGSRHRPQKAGTAVARLGLSGEHRGHEAADRRDAAADAGRGHPDSAEPRRLVGRARRRRRHRPGRV